MSEGDYPLSPPQAPYARPPDLDSHDTVPPPIPHFSHYSRRPLPSHTSGVSWVSQNVPPTSHGPPPPPEPINIPPPVLGARGASEISTRPPTGFDAGEEYMDIDPNAVARDANGFGAQPMTYPHPMEVGLPRNAKRRKGGFVGGFFTGLLRRRGGRGGKLEKRGPSRHNTLEADLDTGEQIVDLSGRAGPIPIPPQYSSQPPTPVTNHAPTNITYGTGDASIRMPIPEVHESNPPSQAQTPVPRRPSLRVSVHPPSEEGSAHSRSRTSSQHTVSHHASTVRQSTDTYPSRRTQSLNARDTVHPPETQATGSDGRHSPDVVLADIQPTEDYRKMQRSTAASTSFSRLDRVQQFFRDLKHLPWIRPDRITTEYKPTVRADSRIERQRHRRERIVVLDDPTSAKKPPRWYYQLSPGHRSVDLLSNGEPSASSGYTYTDSRSSQTPTGSSARSPRRRNSAEGINSPRYSEEYRSPRPRRSRTPPYDSPRQVNGRRHSPPTSSTASPPHPSRHHRAHPASPPNSPPQHHHHHQRTSYSTESATPPPPQRHHGHNRDHRNRHRTHGDSRHQKPSPPPPVPPIPHHLQPPPPPPPQPFAIPMYPTYIQYATPVPVVPAAFASPNHPPIVVARSRDSPVPNVVNVNPGPGPPEGSQLLQQQQQHQYMPHSHQAPPQGQPMSGLVSPLVIPSFVPGAFMPPGGAAGSPTTAIPGQYIYNQPQPRPP